MFAEVALMEGIEKGLTLCASEYTVSLVRVGEAGLQRREGEGLFERVR